MLNSILLCGNTEIRSRDGFVLNIGSEDWQKDRVADCFQATEAPGLSSFKLFFSFDMRSVTAPSQIHFILTDATHPYAPSSSVVPCKVQGDIQHLLEYIERWGNHPSMYRRNGKVVVSTFAGESSLFGFDDMEPAWCFVKKCLGEIVPASTYASSKAVANDVICRYVLCLHSSSTPPATVDYTSWTAYSMYRQ